MIAVDNTFLALMLHPNARPPLDPSTNLPVSHVAGRMELWLEALESDGETVIIPTPVLTEFLIITAKDGPRYVTAIDRSHVFRVESFDQRAAIELAARNLEIRAEGGGRRGDMDGTYAKITFDRQIVAIAKVNGAYTIYSDDEGVEKFAKRCGISVVKTWELPLPDVEQTNLLTMLERLEGESVEVKDEDKNEGQQSHAEPEMDTKPEPQTDDPQYSGERSIMFAESDGREAEHVNPDSKPDVPVDEKPSEQ